MNISITKSKYHPSGNNIEEEVFSCNIPDNIVVLTLIIEGISKALRWYSENFPVPPLTATSQKNHINTDS